MIQELFGGFIGGRIAEYHHPDKFGYHKHCDSTHLIGIQFLGAFLNKITGLQSTNCHKRVSDTVFSCEFYENILTVIL